MKYNLYNSIMWIACLIMASCSEQELLEQVSKPVHSNTLQVVTEKQVSRSVLNYEGNFYWTENDYIGVYGSETENARFHCTSQTDKVSTFTGSMNSSGEKVSWAYFPYSEKVNVKGNRLSVPMPIERNISNENHSLMIGHTEDDNTVCFYHTGGILYLKLVGLPEYASQLVITSVGENSPYLAGMAIIDDITDYRCNYHIEEGSREVVYNVQNINKNEYLYTIYLPLEVGNYEKIKVTLKNETGGIIKERSLSDLTVARAKMTETPVLNFSENLFGYKVPEEWLAETGWEEAILFSNEWLIGCNNEDEDGRTYFISNVMDWGSQDAKALQVTMDADGNVLNMTSGNLAAYFSNRNGDYVDITLMLEDKIETITNQYIPSRKARSRAGVDSYIVSDILDVKDFVDGLKNATKVIKPDSQDFKNIERELGLNQLGLQAISMAIENDAVKIVIGIAGETLSGACEGAIAGLTIGMCTGNPAAAVSGAAVGATAGAIKGALTAAVKELEAWNNKRIYEKFCGNAQIVLGEPQQINDRMFSIEYSLSNTQSVPDAYKWYGKCGLLVKEFPNYDIINHSLNRIRYGGIGVRSYGERNLTSNWTHVEKITFRKGYTYLIVAYVTAFNSLDINVANTLNPICYYSDVKKITFHNSSITNVTISPNNPMAYSNNNFHTTVRANAQSDAKNWKVSILRNGQPYVEQSYSGNKTQEVVFNLSLSWAYFKVNTLNSAIKPYDKWQIAVVSMDGNGNSSSQSVDLNFVYDIPAYIDIVSARIINTEQISNPSRAADDDEDEEEGVNRYKTTYEITVQVKGAPRFRYFQVSSSQGKLYSGNIKPHKDGTYVYQGTIVYKENDAPEYIHIDGNAFYYSGDYEHFGASIRCIGSPIQSCEIR